MITTPTYKFKKRQLIDVPNIEVGEDNWDTVETELLKKIDKTQIKSTLTETVNGNVLDATQGKILNDKINTKADSSHTHSNYVNQNAFSNIKVGTNIVSADNATDTVELVAGDNITLTTNATNDSVTIVARDTVYTHPNDSSTRHVTDTQISTWTAKETTSGSQAKADKALLEAKTYTDTKIASLVDTAPETLDTLNELAQALGNDPNFATTVTNQIGTKVDKIAGMGLSTNDYTTAEKTKLSSISNGAEVNQNAFANVKVGATTIIADSKSDTIEFIAGSNVTITPDATLDKVTISATDTVYTHPNSHPSTMITGLHTVATSGNYNDLQNKPDIESIINGHDTNPLSHSDIRKLIDDVKNEVGSRGYIGNAIGVTDCNNMVKTGVYSGYNIPNSPKTGHYYLFFVMAWDATTYVQIAVGMGGSFNLYYRWHTVTGWQEWQNPSDGGNADTVDGFHAYQLQCLQNTGSPYGDRWLESKWNGSYFDTYSTTAGNSRLELSVGNADKLDGKHASDFLPKVGGTVDGALKWLTTNANDANGIEGGNGDNATFEACNLDIFSWNGIGFYPTAGGNWGNGKAGRSVVIDPRSGYVKAKGGFEVNGINVMSEINSLKSSVSSGKTAIANAITGKGVSASGSDTHATLANKITQIKTARGIKGSTSSTSSYSAGLFPTMGSPTAYTTSATLNDFFMQIAYRSTNPSVKVTATTDTIAIAYNGDTIRRLNAGESYTVGVSSRYCAFIINPTGSNVKLEASTFQVGRLIY